MSGNTCTSQNNIIAHAKYICPSCNKPTGVRTRAEMIAVFNPDGNVNAGETNVYNLDPCGPDYQATCMLCGHDDSSLHEFECGPCSVCEEMADYGSGAVKNDGNFVCSKCLHVRTADDDSQDECAICCAMLTRSDMYGDTKICINCMWTFAHAMSDFCASSGYAYMPLRVDEDLTGTDTPFAAIIADASPFQVMAEFAIWLRDNTDMDVHRLFAHYGQDIMHTTDGCRNVINFITCNPPD